MSKIIIIQFTGASHAIMNRVNALWTLIDTSAIENESGCTTVGTDNHKSDFKNTRDEIITRIDDKEWKDVIYDSFTQDTITDKVPTINNTETPKSEPKGHNQIEQMSDKYNNNIRNVNKDKISVTKTNIGKPIQNGN